ncbi:bactericidal permeability-increasing protein-like [Salarias fasciatus]|uniref:Bactericidal permeability-increasing protein n=1 Tax=Salarias fasciatus TaxID=181472 RepID=A0A672FAK2_SALFA|nr:bactericidal permeability-increasing protein-like [Salarias fasciatus]
MFLCLALLTLLPATVSISPGVKVELTQKGIDYGRQLGIASIQSKLKTIRIPDISGTTNVPAVGKVKYSLSGLQLLDVGLPKSALDLVTGSGVRLSIGDAYMKLRGNWKVKYLKFITDHGSFDLNVNGLTITTSIKIDSDDTGRPAVSTISCSASVGSLKIQCHGGDKWMCDLFKDLLEKFGRKSLEKQICPLVQTAVSELNPELKTMNVLAKVDQYAEIEYSMVSSPVISNTSLVLNLKGEFYNIGKHQEPPFTATDFSMPTEANNMMYMGISAFTVNSAAFVYTTAGILSLYITDDMIPKSSPFRLTTKSFGIFVPQVEEKFPDLPMKLLVKAVKSPTVTFEPDNMTIQAAATVTAYAIQPNATLSPLFVLSLESSVSGRVFVSGIKLAGEVTLQKMNMTLVTSYVGDFRVESLDKIFKMVINLGILPKLNERLAQGYPLPMIGKMKLVSSQLHILKDYMLIGTDVQFMD